MLKVKRLFIALYLAIINPYLITIDGLLIENSIYFIYIKLSLNIGYMLIGRQGSAE